MRTYFNINYEPDRANALSLIDKHSCSTDKAEYVCVADGNILAMVHRDSEYRTIINDSMFSIVDSSWVPLYIKWIYGYKWQQYCGSQIFHDIISLKKYRMLFLGTSQYTLDALKSKLVNEYDESINDMTFYELPFCNVDEFDYEAIANFINNDNPDIIWVALGAPKQEIFMNKLKPHLNRGVMIAVGAVFKFYSGVGEQRAPKWMINHHMEFVYRIFKEPKKQLSRVSSIITALPAIYYEEYKRAKINKC